MYLLTAAQCDACLSNQPPNYGAGGFQGGVSTGAAANSISKYAVPLALIKSRVEESLEVDTLDRVNTTDVFNVTTRGDSFLRLTNGFILNPSIMDKDGELLDISGADVDEEKGIIFLGLTPGRYRVTYDSGFEVDVDKFAIDLPEWLQSIAMYTLNLHYRTTTMAEKTPENVSFGDLQPAVLREMRTRVTKRYERARVEVYFPLRSVRNG